MLTKSLYRREYDEFYEGVSMMCFMKEYNTCLLVGSFVFNRNRNKISRVNVCTTS